MKRKRLLLKVIIIGLPITVFLLWITGAINLWFYGMGDISDNVKFYSLELKPIDGEYSVLIDLSDLESNKGKILYDDGEHQIYISDVFISNEENYEVFFRSRGKYNLHGATLVSGIAHKRVQGGFAFGLFATAKATYRGDTFKLYASGTSGLNFKDGDSFGLYLIPHDREVTLNIAEDPIIEITLSNLIMHKWASKYGI
ncbi:hypothetical protein [Solibacillus isronensis]|uniref:hypothetical protein n=1 Tax=Solibacillus isronensis TaxID=412383 RepID=UPI0039A18EC5